jgi:hypothetical protein
MMMDVTVVCGAPTGCVFDLSRRIAPEHYWLLAIGHMRESEGKREREIE